MSTVEGELEIDHERGVVYFHSNDGHTVLRICGLPRPIPQLYDYVLGDIFLDVTHMYGANWKGSLPEWRRRLNEVQNEHD